MNYIVQCHFVLKASYLKWVTIKYFGFQWKSLQDKKGKLNDLKLPKSSKTLQMIKWMPSASTKIDSMVGSRGVPLGYCREKPDYSVPAPDFFC